MSKNQTNKKNMPTDFDNELVVQTVIPKNNEQKQVPGPAIPKKYLIIGCFILTIVIVGFFLIFNPFNGEKDNNIRELQKEALANAKKSKIQEMETEALKFEMEITVAEAKIIENKTKITSIRKTVNCLNTASKIDDCTPKNTEKKDII